jgi:hypothetical protein
MSTNLVQVENTLEIVLPEFYKKIMQEYPFEVKEDLDFVEDNLVKETEWLINENKDLRQNGFFSHFWPNHLFAIGHDGFGNYIFLNLKGNDPKIYLVNHDENIDFNDISDIELSSTMSEYIAECIEEQDDVLANT